MWSDYGDGDVFVWETFVNPLVLRDGSLRDLAGTDLNIVFDVAHNYDHDMEDIYQLLNFRVAMIPKSWTDVYGDTIRVSTDTWNP